MRGFHFEWSAFIEPLGGPLYLVGMANRSSLRVSIPPELEEFVSSRVASGRYGSASEVVCQSLRLLEGLEFAEDTATFRPLVALGLQQARRGELLDGDEVFESLERRIGSESKPGR